MFVITIVWGIGYLIAYPGMGNFPGVLGWTSLEQHEQEVARPRKSTAPCATLPGHAHRGDLQDPKARKMGMRIYGNNCSSATAWTPPAPWVSRTS
jgi:cytochrome c oxidase cbb3-type subunit 3